MMVSTREVLGLKSTWLNRRSLILSLIRDILNSIANMMMSIEVEKKWDQLMVKKGGERRAWNGRRVDLWKTA